MVLRVFKILDKTKVEGPGVRFCIWVQGCSRHCEGCWAKETWSDSEGEIFSVDELFEKIKNTEGIEGVTFLGGEPFEQADSLALLAEKIKSIGLSILTFSGYKYEELLSSQDEGVKKLLSHTDLLIDGAYEKDNASLSRPWVGSDNQRYIFLTQRYSQKDIDAAVNKLELRIAENGEIFINGMADMGEIERVLCLQKIKTRI